MGHLDICIGMRSCRSGYVEPGLIDRPTDRPTDRPVFKVAPAEGRGGEICEDPEEPPLQQELI
jgi:hypothetical protein